MSRQRWADAATLVLMLAMLSLFAVLVLNMGGCAVGRGPGGEIVIGIGVAKLVETVNEAAPALLEGLGIPAAIAGPAALLGGILLRTSKKQIASEREAAELRGHSAGWDDREKVAAVQLPLPETAPGSGQ